MANIITAVLDGFFIFFFESTLKLIIVNNEYIAKNTFHLNLDLNQMSSKFFYY